MLQHKLSILENGHGNDRMGGKLEDIRGNKH